VEPCSGEYAARGTRHAARGTRHARLIAERPAESIEHGGLAPAGSRLQSDACRLRETKWCSRYRGAPKIREATMNARSERPLRCHNCVWLLTVGSRSCDWRIENVTVIYFGTGRNNLCPCMRDMQAHLLRAIFLGNAVMIFRELEIPTISQLSNFGRCQILSVSQHHFRFPERRAGARGVRPRTPWQRTPGISTPQRPNRCHNAGMISRTQPRCTPCLWRVVRGSMPRLVFMGISAQLSSRRCSRWISYALI
jgi:hypothetical protein